MSNIETRKKLALSFSCAYIFLVCICTIFNLAVPQEFTIIVTTVIAYYFGGETALDTVENHQKEDR
ncbi:MAG: hypothetical protein BEN19_03630 [Epulopiscium sp. Nuni2H_MBin003]|nr:MAG: hypothetical protein BEN19_03630 [Epulopiscium sp. Nuni2H_MBin003]